MNKKYIIYTFVFILNTAFAEIPVPTLGIKLSNDVQLGPIDNPEVVSDTQLMAEGLGITYEQALNSIKVRKKALIYRQYLRKKYPGKISRAWTEVIPGTKSYVQFIGEIPDGALNDPRHSSETALLGGGKFTAQERSDRASAIADEMVASGVGAGVGFSVGYHAKADVIEIRLKLPENVIATSDISIISIVNRALSKLTGEVQALSFDDVVIEITRGEGPFAELAHARGGNRMLKDGNYQCTSGWSVITTDLITNVTGILTAGHCIGVNQMQETGGLIFSAPTSRTIGGGAGGSTTIDARFHTTTHIELGQFFASANSIRDVSFIRATENMLDETICRYGRVSNIRTCNHTIFSLGNTVIFAGASADGGDLRIRGLAFATNNSSVPGDSGGGWSFNNTAWGIHTGFSSDSVSYFTPIQVAQEALSVAVFNAQ